LAKITTKIRINDYILSGKQFSKLFVGCSLRLEASTSPFCRALSDSQSLLGWLVELVTELGGVINAGYGGRPVIPAYMSPVRSGVISPGLVPTYSVVSINLSINQSINQSINLDSAEAQRF